MKCPLCGYETRVHVRMGECPVRSNPPPEPKDIYSEGLGSRWGESGEKVGIR